MVAKPSSPASPAVQERLCDLYSDYRGHRADVACHALVEFGHKVGGPCCMPGPPNIHAILLPMPIPSSVGGQL